jgi:hypothetical protein
LKQWYCYIRVRRTFIVTFSIALKYHPLSRLKILAYEIALNHRELYFLNISPKHLANFWKIIKNSLWRPRIKKMKHNYSISLP